MAIRLMVFVGFVLLIWVSCTSATQNNDKELFVIKGESYDLIISQDDFSFYFSDKEGHVVAPANPDGGIAFSGRKVIATERIEPKEGKNHVFLVTNESGEKAKVLVSLENDVAHFQISPQKSQNTNVSLSLGGMPVAHGLGDAGAYGAHFNLADNDIDAYDIENNGMQKRWVSTFAIFPPNNVAGAFFGDGKKRVVINAQEYTMNISGEASFYYILGTPREIYKNYKKVRELEGYADVIPKFRLFELGWESWDALGWNTNQETVKQVMQQYLNKGYPIRWAVTGSGFWDEGGTTTSFGRFGEKFPDPIGFKAWMHQNDIYWMIGQRTNLIPSGGPYFPITEKRDRNLKVQSFYGNKLSDEALARNLFFKDNSGHPLKITSPIFPIVPCYLIDGDSPGADIWFQQQYAKWNVDGIKEDTMMDTDSVTNIYNKPIVEIANKGGLVMARNGEISSPGTLLRANDTKVSDLSKRTPINYFQYAASGFPNVYSDVAGIHNMHNLKEADLNIRHTWLLSLTAGISVGAYPEQWSVDKQNAFKKAINFHVKLAPYMFSSAIENYHTGYPSTLTPLSIAYPNDSAAAQLKNFEWMIGESILATPKLNDDNSGMDIYLPEGIWFDYESGKKYQGPMTLMDFDMNLDKTPCFIGGKGIIVERIGNDLFAKIYPVTDATVITFTYPSGKAESKISVQSINFSKAMDFTTKKAVEFKKDGQALIFELKEGHDYKIE